MTAWYDTLERVARGEAVTLHIGTALCPYCDLRECDADGMCRFCRAQYDLAGSDVEFEAGTAPLSLAESRAADMERALRAARGLGWLMVFGGVVFLGWAAGFALRLGGK